MARKVKCSVSGKWGTSDTFIKIDGKYYENKEVYEEQRKQTEYWKKAVEKITVDYLGYHKGEPYPTILNKRLKSLDFYSNEVIYRTILYSDSSIRNALNSKEFNSTYAKIQYIMAIIRNNIAKVWKIVRTEQKEQKQKIANEKNDILNMDGLENINNPKQVNKDISKFVGD